MTQSFERQHGLGANVACEAAAAEGKVGELRRDPFTCGRPGRYGAAGGESASRGPGP
ncbi:hypothetical protein OHS70_23190 [Streptomyces sp. NBC_00390]|uniref:hypothetical protein n=1 Tax=Streptomyces sp. NBC_00390 TaxID=2975736 RepID=UPI002E1D6191